MTDTEIVLGTISSISGPVPGFGSSAAAATRSYVAYRNANGGVCGRQLVLREADDGFDNGRNRSLYSELTPQVLGFVGGISLGDAGGAEIVEREQVPVVMTAASEQFQNVSTVFDINPPFADVHAPIGKYRYLYDSGIRTAAVIYPGIDQARSEMVDKQIPQMEAVGIQVVLQQELPSSTLSFDSTARAVANSGADYMIFLGETGTNASMARSLADAGYTLDVAEYITGYGAPFIELAGPAAEGAVSWIRTFPNEEVGANPEHATFLEWMAQTAPDSPPDSFASDSWVAAKALIDSLEALSGPISRDALLAQLRSISTYDAGGMLGPIQLGSKLNNGCFVAMQVTNGAWRRLTPASGYLC